MRGEVDRVGPQKKCCETQVTRNRMLRSALSSLVGHEMAIINGTSSY